VGTADNLSIFMCGFCRNSGRLQLLEASGSVQELSSWWSTFRRVSTWVNVLAKLQEVVDGSVAFTSQIKGRGTE